MNDYPSLPRHLSSIAVICVVCSLCAGCGQSKARGGSCILCLFDVAEGAANSTARAEYLQDFAAILAAQQPGDLLLVGVPRHDGGVDVPVRFRMGAEHLDSVVKGRETTTASVREEVSSIILRGPKSRGPSMIDTLYSTGPVLNGHECRTAGRRTLVVFSRMQDGPSRRQDLTVERIELFIRRLQQDRRLPDLRSVDVWVSGVRSPDTDPERSEGTEYFWVAYFGRSGASFSPEHYRPRLRSFHFPR